MISLGVWMSETLKEPSSKIEESQRLLVPSQKRVQLQAMHLRQIEHLIGELQEAFEDEGLKLEPEIQTVIEAMELDTL